MPLEAPVTSATWPAISKLGKSAIMLPFREIASLRSQ
jgi:hypothetical protein